MNKIFITINIDKNDVGKTIYVLDNYYNYKISKYSRDHLKELNEYNTEFLIDGKQIRYK